jgi:GLPGLI family protein
VRFRNLLFIAVLIVAINYSCREKGGKYISEGEIYYNIEYIGSTSSFSKDLMPKNLVVSFKNDKILFEIMAPVGSSGIMNLVNPDQNIYDTYISLFGTKYYYAGKPGELHPGFEAMAGMELKKTKKTTVICGYNCNNAEVTFPSDRSKIYNIWYTDEIKVKNSNMSTPFNGVDGVLMSFFFFLGKSEMRFEAETVYKKDIPDKYFERRPKFKPVSRDNMDKIITDMVNL